MNNQLFSSRNPLLIAIISLSAVLLSLSLFYYLTYNTLQKTTTVTDEKEAVIEYIERLDNIQNNLLIIESAEKPSVIKERADLTTRFNTAAKNTIANLDTLRTFYQYPFLPIEQMKTYEKLVLEKISFTQNIIQLVLSGHKEKAYAILTNPNLFSATQSLNEYDKLLVNKGRSLLLAYQDVHDRNAHKTQDQFLILGFCLLFILGFSFYKIISISNSRIQINTEKRFLTNAFDLISEAIIIADEDFRVTQFNAAAEKMYHIKKIAIIGKDVFSIGMPENNVDAAELLHTLKETSKWSGILNSSGNDQNSPITIFSSISALKDDRNNIIGYCFANIDLTDFTQNIDRKKYLAEVFENSHDAIIGTNTNHLIKAWNKAAEKMFGYNYAEILGKPVSDVLIVDKDVRNNFRQEVSENGYWRGNVDIKLKEGNIIKTLFTISSIKNEKGIITDYVGTIKDVTPILELQENLKELNNSLQEQVKEKSKIITEILERIDDGFVAINQNNEFTYVSSYISKLTGKKIDDLIGKNYLEVFPELQPTFFAQYLSQSQLSKESRHYEVYSKIWSRWLDINIYPSANGVSIFLKDISKRKTQDAELRLKEISIEKSIAGIGIADLTGTITYGNNALIKMWGCKNKEELIGKKLTEVFEGPRVYETIKNLQTKGFDSGEDIGKRIDGSLFNVGFSANVVLDDNNNPLCLFGSFVDVTDLKKQSQEIEMLAGIIENSSALAYIMDMDQKIIYLNKAIKQACGLDEKDATGRSAADIFSDNNKLSKSIINAVIQNKKWEGESYYLSKKQKEIPVLQALHLHTDEHGNPSYISATAIDITELREKEKELKKFSNIVENTKALVIIATLDYSLLYANKAAKEKLEIADIEDLNKIFIYEFMPEETKAFVKLEENKLMAQGMWVDELNLQTRNGKVIPVLQVAIIHKDDEGNPLYISFTLLDVTKQKAAELELIKLNSELRELSNHLQDIREEERSEIAREIHDVLGQNLTVLKMAASWAQKHIHDNPAGAERRLEELMEVTDETIHASRKLYNALHPNMLDDIGLVAAIQWHANSFTKTTGIDIEVYSDFSHKILNSKIRLGLYRIYQESTTNILRHANATHVLVNLSKHDGLLTMTISDNGVGFDTNKVDILHSHGLLGLRERVYAMSGKLNIKTAVGQGTSIEVIIPMNEEFMGADNFENTI
jgi:PAS domain S-box-containing protein